MVRLTKARLELFTEMTRGVQLPLSGVENADMQAIVEGIRRAFVELQETAPETIQTGSEVEVTALLQARFSQVISKDAYLSEKVLSVGRGSESISFDGFHLEKRPDLSIVLQDRDSLFPLVLEAKILDVARSKTVRIYCENGILRFVRGEYAWTNREALMIGYVRDDSSTSTTLRFFLLNAMETEPHLYLVQALTLAVGWSLVDLAVTQHDREFKYEHQQPRDPGPISIWHLWLA